jgi:hypothetical protein
MSWYASRQYCERSNLQLAIFESLEDMKLVWNVACKSCNYLSKFFLCFHGIHYGSCFRILANYWVDASDIGRSYGNFFWGNNQTVNNAWWFEQDPNDKGPGKETCVYLHRGKICDSPCLSKQLFICQVPAQHVQCMQLL